MQQCPPTGPAVAGCCHRHRSHAGRELETRRQLRTERRGWTSPLLPRRRGRSGDRVRRASQRGWRRATSAATHARAAPTRGASIDPRARVPLCATFPGVVDTRVRRCPGPRLSYRQWRSAVPLLPGAEPFHHDGGPVGVLLCHGFTGSRNRCARGRTTWRRTITPCRPACPDTAPDGRHAADPLG